MRHIILSIFSDLQGLAVVLYLSVTEAKACGIEADQHDQITPFWQQKWDELWIVSVQKRT